VYDSYFGLTELPFSIAPDPRYLYLSDGHREALAHLLYGIGAGGGFLQLTGEVGTGKTTVCRALLEQLPPEVDVAMVFNPALTAVELLATVCEELHIEHPRETTSFKVLGDALYRYLLDAHARGRRTVIIIDEAQNLGREVLEQIRLLTNLETTREKLLQVILIGQPELRQLLTRPDLRQLAQRVTARYHLKPFSERETRAYIHHRLRVAGQRRPIFDRRAIRAVHRHARGIPRLINTICDRALLGAYARPRARRRGHRAPRRPRGPGPAGPHATLDRGDGRGGHPAGGRRRRHVRGGPPGALAGRRRPSGPGRGGDRGPLRRAPASARAAAAQPGGAPRRAGAQQRDRGRLRRALRSVASGLSAQGGRSGLRARSPGRAALRVPDRKLERRAPPQSAGDPDAHGRRR
jgi:type II secretory pathway predicted ATPase ExeA